MDIKDLLKNQRLNSQNKVNERKKNELKKDKVIYKKEMANLRKELDNKSYLNPIEKILKNG